MTSTVSFPSSAATTAVEFHGPFAVVRHDFSRAADSFYTTRDTRTGRDLSYSYRQLRNARRVARTQAALVAGR